MSFIFTNKTITKALQSGVWIDDDNQRMDMKGVHQNIGSWLKSLERRESQAVVEKIDLFNLVKTKEMTKPDESQASGQSSKANEMTLTSECKEVKCKIDIVSPEPEKQTCLTSRELRFLSAKRNLNGEKFEIK